jgi:predicted flap endonuclease-1-like 5' DNA nuclease
MVLELVFLACSLIGAFAIGLGTAWLGFRKRLKANADRLQESDMRALQVQETADRLQGKVEALEERLGKAIDHERYEALQARYQALEATQQALEERQWMGWQESDSEGLRFMESIGVAITGEVPPAEKDDLTRVRGISPYIENRLNAIGIRTYNQLGRLNDDEARRVNEAIELLPGRIRRERWVEQCRAMDLTRKGA